MFSSVNVNVEDGNLGRSTVEGRGVQVTLLLREKCTRYLLLKKRREVLSRKDRLQKKRGKLLFRNWKSR